MAARPLWKGSLKLSLITIAVRIYNAVTPSGDVSFRQVHKKCGTPIQLKKWCPKDEEEVSSSELAKGYEVSKGEFVLLDPEDIKAVRPPATYTVEISRVVDQSEIQAHYIERPYYVMPENKTAGSALAVIREALSGRAGIGTVAWHGREYLVAIVPKDSALMMLTLRRADELVDVKDLESPGTEKRVDQSELKLARRVLDGFSGHLDLSEYPDEYEKALRKMIQDKIEGNKIVAPAMPKPGKVVNLMDALRRSLEEAPAGRRRTQRAAAPPPSRRGRHARGRATGHAHRPRRRAARAS